MPAAKMWIATYLLLCPAIMLWSQQPVYHSEFVYENAPTKSCHASTLAETPKGVVVAWFGGTHENNPDVGIWVSRRVKGKWTTPVEVVNGIQHTNKRYPCWNPVLFYDKRWGLLLFYKVGPNPREWWGEMVVSSDYGKTWGQPRRLPEDILGPVKNKPVSLPDGRLLCPSSTEHDGWKVHIEITPDGGKTWKRIGPLEANTEWQAIQPSLLLHPGGKLQLLCRSKNNRILEAWSADGGFTWSALHPTSLPNPNSGIDAVTTENGTHLLLYNPTETPAGEWGGERWPLVLARSTDGKTWADVLTLESEPGEYSYPAIIQSSKGKILLCYTWKREKIKFVEVEAW